MTVVTDDFNRSDEDLGDSSDWTEDQGDWEVVSNQVRMENVVGGQSGYYKARWAGPALDGDNNYCELVIVDIGSAAIGPGARLTADTDVSGYMGMGWSGDTWYLVDMTAGSENILGTWGTPAGGEALRVEAESTTIRLKVGGTERVSVTDSSYSSGVPGLFAYGLDQDADDWEAGDIGGGETYYQSVAGALTFTGGLVKKTSKSLSGSITPTGSLVKKTSKGLAGVMTFSGSLDTSATFRQALSGAMTFAGTLSTSLTMRQALSGAISFVGGLATQYTAGPGGAWIRWIDHRLLKWRKKFQ